MDLNYLRKLDKKYAQAIANYLLNRIEIDSCLKAKLEETDKTLKGCVEYIKDKAKEEAEDSVAIIEDQQVYEWAVHYFLEDSIDKEFHVKNYEAKKKVEQTKEIKEVKKAETKRKDVKKKLVEQLSLFDL